MRTGHFNVHWLDLKREPRDKANPAYPDGIDLDLSRGATACCTVELPYPAKRCGQYHVLCQDCRVDVICTTAGRRDDPRSVTMRCKAIRR